jgi:hypothetical protein
MRVCLSQPTDPLGVGCAAVCPLFMINFPVPPPPLTPTQAPLPLGFPCIQEEQAGAAWHFAFRDCGLGGVCVGTLLGVSYGEDWGLEEDPVSDCCSSHFLWLEHVQPFQSTPQCPCTSSSHKCEKLFPFSSLPNYDFFKDSVSV